ncbi:nuclear transcription factor Y subunit C-1-like [Lycium ferocissimum]|uniref:nuclear transcription factor Y subunit C-1-like n=1 Tax=Lycium ferocissimum TaxID=112874 RepID=UPI0028151642|nr:nuclear transcription factor Y subunit C-1-like [Lycium ferocissimum]
MPLYTTPDNHPQQSAAAAAQFGGYPPVASSGHLLEKQQQQLEMFWTYQRQQMENANDFKNQQLPLARIKRIMKADRDVRMVSSEAPILFAKACEFFILELTTRSWLHAEENKRRTLHKKDLEDAISRDEIFDFLVDVVPGDENEEEADGIGPGIMGSTESDGPFYYPPMGQPAMPGVDMSMYLQPPPSPSQAWQSVWQAAAAADASGQDNPDDQS